MSGGGATFARVLRERLEADDGVVLRLSTYRRMHAERDRPGGWTAGLRRALATRSRMIRNAVAALGRRTNEQEEE